MLTDKERKVLDFEGAWWHYPQPKDRAVRDYLGMSATRYYQVLRRLIDDDEALAHAPLTVRRLRRMRRQRLEGIADRMTRGDSLG